MALEGLQPDDLDYSRKPETPKREARTVPGDIERHVFAETRLTAYCPKNAAWFLLRDSRVLDTRRVCQRLKCRAITCLSQPGKDGQTPCPLSPLSHMCHLLNGLSHRL